MIVYFSATGNCRHVAERVGVALHEKPRSILSFPKEGRIRVDLACDEPLVVVGPTYAWGLALPMRGFLSRLRVDAPYDQAYLCYIATYGTSSGYSAAQASAILARSCRRGFDVLFDIKMPDTWTPTYDLSDVEKVAAINEQAEVEIAAVAGAISARRKGDHRKSPLPFAAALFGESFYRHMRQTKYLHAEKTCISCGLCARNCPVGAIEMREGRPVWKKKRCAMCLACLHRCPRFAIQYGSRTKNHGQYVHPRV